MKYETKIILIAVLVIGALIGGGIWYIRSITQQSAVNHDQLQPDHMGGSFPQTALFTVDQERGKAPLTVTFNAPVMIRNEHPRFLWDFGDGANASKRIVQHTFEKSGVYTVTLTAVFEDKQQETAKKTIVVE